MGFVALAFGSAASFSCFTCLCLVSASLSGFAASFSADSFGFGSAGSCLGLHLNLLGPYRLPFPGQELSQARRLRARSWQCRGLFAAP